MGLANRIADRIAMMRRGRILTVDTPERFARSADRFVRGFLEGELPEVLED
jgi:ABC-type proline/glycine betaine transport system ATPase subunit